MIDERLKQDLNKIRSEIFVLIYFIVAVSFIVKNLYLDTGFESSITEFIILVIVPVYTYLRASMLKLSMADFYSGGKKYITSTILSCLVACAVFIYILVNKQQMQNAEAVISVIAFVAAFMAVRFIMLKIFKKQKDKNDRFFE